MFLTTVIRMLMTNATSSSEVTVDGVRVANHFQRSPTFSAQYVGNYLWEVMLPHPRRNLPSLSNKNYTTNLGQVLSLTALVIVMNCISIKRGQRHLWKLHVRGSKPRPSLLSAAVQSRKGGDHLLYISWHHQYNLHLSIVCQFFKMMSPCPYGNTFPYRLIVLSRPRL